MRPAFSSAVLAVAWRPILRILRACGMFELMCSSRVGEQYGDHESDSERVWVSEYNTVKVRQRIAVEYQRGHVATNCEIFYTSKPNGSITMTQNLLGRLTKSSIRATHIDPHFALPAVPVTAISRIWYMITRIVLIFYYYIIIQLILYCFYRCI